MQAWYDTWVAFFFLLGPFSYYILRNDIIRTFNNRKEQYGSYGAVPEDEEDKLRGSDLQQLRQLTMGVQGGIDVDKERDQVAGARVGRSSIYFGVASRRRTSYAPASQAQAEDDYHRLKQRMKTLAVRRMNSDTGDSLMPPNIVAVCSMRLQLSL